uniref:TIR domain-containing protein n=1 Tax=Megaselia scalaris TaxID=36166 RepID=T1H4N4_MEGSC
MRSVYGDIFDSLLNIRRINLSSNKLKAFEFKSFIRTIYKSDGVFKFYEELIRKVGVTNVQLNIPTIEELRTGILKKELDLRNNKLSNLDVDFFKRIEDFDILTYLSGNDWKCNCQDLTFFEIVKNNYFIRDDITCYVNGNNEISTKSTHKDLQDICEESDYSVLVSILAPISALLFILLVMVSFKNEIKVWLFAHNMFVFWIAEDEIDKDRIYDAFICFQERDESFVEQIVNVLENGPNPYRLCLHFRDWIVGDYITKQIVNSVEQSKRTVFIITSNFLDSMWSRLEFRAACAASLREKRPRVIVILCQEMDELGDLDDEIKSYFKTNTYLKWDDKLFWSRLKYALPHKKSADSDEMEMKSLLLDY